MAANITRLLGNNRPIGLGTSHVFNSRNRAMSCQSFSVICKMGFQGERIAVAGDGEKIKPVKASIALADTTVTTKTRDSVNLAFVLAYVTALVYRGLKVIAKPRPWRSHIQMFIERVVMDTRFFTILAVAGTLLGSVLCFVEGCFIIAESYLQYLQAISHRSGSDHGHHIMHLLIEAMDMYLVGTALLIFGTGLHVMFMGTHNFKGKGSTVLPKSNFFGLFHLENLPSWTGMKSIAQAKTKIGHALMMILQVLPLSLNKVPVSPGHVCQRALLIVNILNFIIVVNIKTSLY